MQAQPNVPCYILHISKHTLKQKNTPKSARKPPADPAKPETKVGNARPGRNFAKVRLAESTNRVRALSHASWIGDQGRSKGRQGLK
jgi:hypothetical protein